VESGENTARPAPAAPPASPSRARTGGGSGSGGRAPAVAKVDPASAPGRRYGVWRSSQHFCVADSIPDAESEDLAAVVAHAHSIMEFRLRHRLVARLDDEGVWHPVGYLKDGRSEEITLAQAEKYRECRLGRIQWSNDKYKPLRESDHPAVTTRL